MSVQHYKRKTIDVERKRRLNKIGFVWDWREYRWENGFGALTKFEARNGHCLVPALHIERKFKLGQWVTIQRRTKNKMSAQRRKRLNDIGDARFAFLAIPIGDLKLLYEINFRAVLALAHVAAQIQSLVCTENLIRID